MMKLLAFTILGCIISYILISLGALGLILGLGLLIGLILRIYSLVLDIHKRNI